MYKIDKTSFKRTLEKVQKLQGQYIYIKADRNSFSLCGYNDEKTLIAHTKIIEAYGRSQIVKIEASKLKCMYDMLSVVRKGIKNRAYFAEILNDKLRLSVEIKDELREPTVKEYFKVGENVKWSREELLEYTKKYLEEANLNQKLKEELDKQKRVILQTLGTDNDTLNVNLRAEIDDDAYRRSIKVNFVYILEIEEAIEDASEAKQKFEFDKNSKSFMIETIQFKEIIAFINLITLEEEYFKGLNNVCLLFSGERCEIISSDMLRLFKASIQINNVMKDGEEYKIIIPKWFFSEFDNANSDNVGIYVKGYLSKDRFALQGEDAILFFNRNEEYVDMYLDKVSKTFRFQNIHPRKKQIKDMTRLINSAYQEYKTSHKKDSAYTGKNQNLSKPKDMSSYNLEFYIEDKTVTDIKINRKELEKYNTEYVYNLKLFHTMMKVFQKFEISYETINIYFDAITSMAFVKSSHFSNPNNFNIIAIFPLKKAS